MLASRTYPAFRQAVMVAELLPPSLMGDYHLGGTGSPAYGRGAASTRSAGAWGLGSYTVSCRQRPTSTGTGRPSLGPTSRYDAGSDQLTP